MTNDRESRGNFRPLIYFGLCFLKQYRNIQMQTLKIIQIHTNKFKSCFRGIEPGCNVNGCNSGFGSNSNWTTAVTEEELQGPQVLFSHLICNNVIILTPVR